MAQVLKFPKKQPDRSMETKWGGNPSIWKEGYVAVPVSFLRSLQTFALPFKLSPAEAMFVIQVMAYKWGAENPWPGYKTLAKHMGITPVYARQLARRLESKKLLKRIVRVGSTNRFDFGPLFSALGASVAKPKVSAKPKKSATPSRSTTTWPEAVEAIFSPAPRAKGHTKPAKKTPKAAAANRASRK